MNFMEKKTVFQKVKRDQCIYLIKLMVFMEVLQSWLTLFLLVLVLLYRIKLKKKKNIVIVFFGDGATEEGVFYESLNFAALHKVPIIFVCENNGFSVYSNLEVRQSSKRNNVTIAEGHGLNTLKGDGNDILEVYDLTKKAIELIKQGKGPVYMEFDTYRWLEHCGPDDDDYLGYRDEKEVKEWKKRCPLKNYQDFLIDEKLINQDEIQDMTSKLDKEIEEAVQFAKSSPFSKKELLFSTVYSN